MKLPTVSIIIPTLNAAKVLGQCLDSISQQDYPRKMIEIVVADGGSADDTLNIAKKYKTEIFKNPLKTGEAGKAVALRYAKGDLVALIDSDNVLPEKDWLKRMTEPFSDEEILGSEPWEFTYRKSDSIVNRYCALIGANDPYCYFVGNYDKKSVLSGKWTGLKMKEEDKGQYVKVKIESGILPTIGANGTIWRAEVLKKAVGRSNYLFDIDIPYIIVKQSPFCFAKVKTGVIHGYCRRFYDFYRKQKRRAKDFFYLEKTGKRVQTYQGQLLRQLFFILSVISVLPLIFQTIKGYVRRPDKAWLFHPAACFITLWVYGTEIILSKFKTEEMSRRGWKQ